MYLPSYLGLRSVSMSLRQGSRGYAHLHPLTSATAQPGYGPGLSRLCTVKTSGRASLRLRTGSQAQEGYVLIRYQNVNDIESIQHLPYHVRTPYNASKDLSQDVIHILDGARVFDLPFLRWYLDNVVLDFHIARGSTGRSRLFYVSSFPLLSLLSLNQHTSQFNVPEIFVLLLL